MEQNHPNPGTGELTLPSGTTLYWQPSQSGGREYISDSIGGGHRIWDTACASVEELEAAIANERPRRLETLWQTMAPEQRYQEWLEEKLMQYWSVAKE